MDARSVSLAGDGVNTLRLIVRGCGTLPGYGAHPGTWPLCFCIALGAIAGVENGWETALIGAGLMLSVFGPVYLFGAYERGKYSADR